MDQTIGITAGGFKNRSNFWTVELQRLADHWEFSYQKRRTAYGMNKLHWWLKFQKAKAQAIRAISKRSRETWRYFCTQLESNDYNKTTAAIKKNQT